MPITAINSNKAAPAGGPYSPALQLGDWVWVSGQGGFDPATGRLGATIEEQTEQALSNAAALLEAAGCSLDNVVSCLVHLSSLDDFARFNAVYERRFPEPRPVRTTVGAALLNEMLVEITVVARRDG